MRHRRAPLLVAVFALGGCAPSVAEPIGTPEPASFDLGLVQAHFAAECANPSFDREYACQRVDVGRMSADGSLLNVPTDLDPSARRDGRADEVCQFPAAVHYGSTGEDLGYRSVAIIGANGGNLATCAVWP